MISTVISSTAIFACSDIEETLTFYKDVLGFESSWTWGEPPTFGSASRGGVTIMFNLQPGLSGCIRGHQHWIKVDDADELYSLHMANGAHVVSEIEDKPWGVREYIVEDINGYHLRFAGPPSSERATSKPFPHGVRVEGRKPTLDEFASVAPAAFHYSEIVPGFLETTWGGVVALSPNGETIGVLRIMQDAPGWFSIWDFAVVPEWQGKRIGSTMLRAAVEQIRQAKPGAIVFLFTYKHGFYERQAFGKDTVSLRRL